MDIEQTVLDVLESVIAMTRTHTDRASEETFTECLACGEVDSHHESCIVPALEAWLTGDTPSTSRSRVVEVPPASSPTSEGREAFERWISDEPFGLSVHRMGQSTAWPGDYHEYKVQLAWCAWTEARRELRASLTEAQTEIERLRADAESFHMDYRMKCDVETKALHAEIERLNASHEAVVKSRDEDRIEAADLRAENERLKAWRSDVTVALMRPGGAHYEDVVKHVQEMRRVLSDIHATVIGECPSLLNEDSGGSAELAMRIERILGKSDGAQ